MKMNTSTTTDELKKLMRIPANACNIEDIFDKIANILKNECVIKYEGNEYRILDFEFYYYNKNHQDISVHPRNSEALCWYINDFGGIDLNFESKIKRSPFSFKYELTDNSYFGGILLGAGGLVRAYSRSASEAVEAAGTADISAFTVFTIKYGYDIHSQIERALMIAGAEVTERNFSEYVSISAVIISDDYEKLYAEIKSIWHKNVEFSVTGTTERRVPRLS